VDTNGGMIVARALTVENVGNPSQMGPLLDQIPREIGRMTAGGTYDQAPTYQIVEQRGNNIVVRIPPHMTAVLSNDAANTLFIAAEQSS
jgi:hypothetical protein